LTSGGNDDKLIESVELGIRKQEAGSRKQEAGMLPLVVLLQDCLIELIINNVRLGIKTYLHEIIILIHASCFVFPLRLLPGKNR